MTWAMDEWRKKNPQAFNFFGNRQYLPKSQYDIEMGKKWRNPWQSYGKEAGTTAPSYADRILREEAVRRENAAMYGPDAMGPGRAGIVSPHSGGRQVQSAGDPSKSATLQTMMSDMMPMDMTRYYKERDTGFAGAMAKTIASGLAKAAKPKEMRSSLRATGGGGQRVFTPETFDTTSWAAPAAPSNYQETLTDPTIETYLRPWRLKHGYT